MTTSVQDFRSESDSLGSLPVPAEVLWGIHTERALQNFPISGIPIGSHRPLVAALGHVKKAAAQANVEAGLIPADIGQAIVEACEEVIRGDVDGSFPVDVVQGGAGTSTNMNANEVVANLALRRLGHPMGSYERVDPIGHVNKCQSTNDVYPTAIRVAILLALEGLGKNLESLAEAFARKGRQFASVSKIGRTQLQDAVPMTLGQEFNAFAVTLLEDVLRLREAARLLHECSLGGTAIGTGITAHPAYAERVIPLLAQSSALPMTRGVDLIEATWDTGAFMSLSGVLKRSAIKLSKISHDLRLLSSGPQAGLSEIILPARQAGSSIMPGKVNPVIPEVVNQIAFHVAAADLTVTMAAENGQLQLNAFEPAICHALLQSISWFTQGCLVLERLCVDGIVADERRLQAQAHASTAEATALLPLLGYEAAAGLVHRAHLTERGVVELALHEGLIDQDQLADLGL